MIHSKANSDTTATGNVSSSFIFSSRQFLRSSIGESTSIQFLIKGNRLSTQKIHVFRIYRNQRPLRYHAHHWCAFGLRPLTVFVFSKRETKQTSELVNQYQNYTPVQDKQMILMACVADWLINCSSHLHHRANKISNDCQQANVLSPSFLAD